MSWDLVRIGDICKTGAGGTPLKSRKEYYDGGTIPWLLSGEVAQGEIHKSKKFITQVGLDNSSAKIFPVDTILVAMYGATAGQIGILRCEATTNQAVCGILPNNHFTPEFMFYAMLSKQAELISSATGNAQPNISQIKVKNTEIPFPSLAEQKRIVAILDEAFAGIDAAVANTENNLANARELFESYLNAVFTEAYADGELVPLSELATDITDGDHMPPPKSETGVPFITIRNINKSTREIDFSDTFKVPREYFDALKPNKKPQEGDVLYTVTGSFGIPVIVNEDAEFCFQRHIGLIRPKSKIDSKWLNYLLLSPQVIQQANEGATGTAQKTVSLKVLRNFSVPVVSLSIQRNSVTRLDALSSETQRLEAIYQQKLKALAELKQSILQKAFAGELTTLPEKEIEEASV